MKLRYKLMAVFVSISLCSVIFVAVVGYRYIARDSKMQINRYLEAKTGEAVEKLDQWISDRAQVISSLSFFLKNPDQEQITQVFLNIYEQYPDISDIYIGFENKQFISGLGWMPPADYDPTVRPWYIAARKAGGINFSLPYLDMTTGKYAISIGTQLRDHDGNLIGVLAEDVLVDTVIEQIQNLDLEGRGYGFLLDNTGYALYHPNPAYNNTNLLENPETVDIVTRILNQRNGYIEYELVNEDKMMVIREVPSTGWIFGTAVYRDIVYQPNTLLKNQFIGIVCIVFVLLITSTLFFSKSLTKRITLLTREAKKIAEGDLEIHFVMNEKDEVGELANAFKTLTSNLATTIHNLQKSEEQYRDLVENSVDYIYSLDMNGRFIAANNRVLDILKLEKALVIGKSVEELNLKSDGEALWISLHQKALSSQRIISEQLEDIMLFGEVRSIDLTFCPLFDDESKTEMIGVTVTVRDISEIKKYERSVHRLAYYDALTELPNRVLLLETMNQLVLMCDAYETKFAIILLNLDNFKKINDTLGHPVGDALLKKLAFLLRTKFSVNNVVARIGGDEFMVILPKIFSIEEVVEEIEDIRKLFESPILVNMNEIYVATSMGVSVYPDDAKDVADLIDHVDTAMYWAKKSGKNNYQFYSDEMKTSLVNRMKVENGLRNAIEKREFKLFYQPIFEAKSRKIRGFEALIRWFRSDMSMVSPMDFIEIAEETGQINEIGEWVLREACQTVVKWQKEFTEDLVISVNISPVQLKNRNFYPLVCDILADTKIKPSHLEMEITEGIFIDSFEEAKKVLDALKSLGIKLSLDDFGTGYSSLSYLKNLSFDTLKIDKAFVADIDSPQKDKNMAGPIIDLVHWLKLETIAEGVETTNQLNYLKEFNCDYIQGYLFSKPLTEEEAVKLLGREELGGTYVYRRNRESS